MKFKFLKSMGSLRFLASLWGGFLLPSLGSACPFCFASTPYRTGLIWATFFMLLVTPILVASVVIWIVRQTKAESINPSSAENRG